MAEAPPSLDSKTPARTAMVTLSKELEDERPEAKPGTIEAKASTKATEALPSSAIDDEVKPPLPARLEEQKASLAEHGNHQVQVDNQNDDTMTPTSAAPPLPDRPVTTNIADSDAATTASHVLPPRPLARNSATTTDDVTATRPNVEVARSSTTTRTAVEKPPLKDEEDVRASSDMAVDFDGCVDSNNEIPSREILRKIENYMVLDKHGKSRTFKSLYSGKHVARRILIIFVRHFFCGQCQEYLHTVSKSITPDALLALPISTFIAVVGCGDPGLIDMYADATGCPFPIYADPTRRLYAELGMVRTLAPGPRPAYTRKSMLQTSLRGITQSLRHLRSGLVTKGGDARQIGGEFLFEPLTLQTPVGTPAPRSAADEAAKQLGANDDSGNDGGGSKRDGDSGGNLDGDDDSHANAVHPPKDISSLDGIGDADVVVEEKRVTWCHRMKTTRDHAEVPELMEVLGLGASGQQPELQPGLDALRWEKAMKVRKGTGKSMADEMRELRKAAEEERARRASEGQNGGGEEGMVRGDN